jgi:hypothetical protein
MDQYFSSFVMTVLKTTASNNAPARAPKKIVPQVAPTRESDQAHSPASATTRHSDTTTQCRS